MKRIAVTVVYIASLACASEGAESADPTRHIICFSGGVRIYEGHSDPRHPVYLGSQDDHVAFLDRDTHKLTRVGGNCIVRWDLPAPNR